MKDEKGEHPAVFHNSEAAKKQKKKKQKKKKKSRYAPNCFINKPRIQSVHDKSMRSA